jgi:hypothetical protein
MAHDAAEEAAHDAVEAYERRYHIPPPSLLPAPSA